MYKNIFDNRQGHNTCKITLSTDGKCFDVYFHLYDYPVQHIWQNLHKNTNKIKQGTNNKFNFDNTVSRLKDLCNSVGTSFETVDQQFLNDLHHRFVESDQSEEWQEINHIIHMLESHISTDTPEYDSSINFYADPNEYVTLDESLKMFLKTEVEWGTLQLGYDTLGKDWLDIAKDNDTVSDLNIQQTISSETKLCFSLEQPFSTYQEQKFYNWATSTDCNVPLNNLNLLSLGKYPLGKIIVTDELLKFHNNHKDWYIPNHACKLAWNQNKIKNNTVVEKVSFFDSDMYYEAAVEHAKF